MVELDLEFAATLATKKDMEDLKNKRPQQPFHIRRAVSAIAAAGVPTVMELGSPSAGRVWNLAQLLVTGADDRTVVAATSAAIYAGDPSSPSVTQLINPAIGAVPVVFDYSDRVIWISSESTLFVVCYGAAANQSLAAVAFLADWRQCDVEPDRI